MTGELLRYEEAIETIRSRARAHSELAFKAAPRSVRVPLTEALGLILDQTIQSRENVPPFHNSAMDGFALRAGELAAKDLVQLRVAGVIAAGDAPATERTPPGHCWEIMTGAPVPADCDTVVKVEDVRVEAGPSGKTQSIEVRGPIEKGENVREAGEDFRVGDTVCGRGTVLEPRHILALATVGVTEVVVLRRPRVALITTGRELAASGEKQLRPGQIRNSTGPYFETAAWAMGLEPVFVSTVSDDPAAFTRALAEALETRPDVVVTTGAVSMGQYDFIPVTLEKLGAKAFFHKAAIRPGKPIYFAELEAGESMVAFFGLPGNPVSTAVGLRFFVAPYAREWLGMPAETGIRVPLASAAAKPKGLRCFYKARVFQSEGELSVEVLPGQASFMVSPLLSANAWVVLPEEGSRVEAGESVLVMPLVSAEQGLRLGSGASAHGVSKGGCC